MFWCIVLYCLALCCVVSCRVVLSVHYVFAGSIVVWHYTASCDVAWLCQTYSSLRRCILCMIFIGIKSSLYVIMIIVVTMMCVCVYCASIATTHVGYRADPTCCGCLIPCLLPCLMPWLINLRMSLLCCVLSAPWGAYGHAWPYIYIYIYVYIH